MKVRIVAATAAVLALCCIPAGAQEKTQPETGTNASTEVRKPAPASRNKDGKSAPASPAASPAAPKPDDKSLRAVASPATASVPVAVSPAPTASGQTVTTPKGESINITVNATPPEPPKSSNWAAGVIGIALLAGLGFFGWKYAQRQGVTVPDALKKLGVELPQDGVAQGARPLKPVVAHEPPLPSLGDLPPVGSAAGVAFASAAPAAFATAPYVGSPRLVGLERPFAGVTLELPETFTIGREADNMLALTQDNTVSRRHAVVERQNGAWIVQDNGSSNGTFVNGFRISGAQTLKNGDEIQVGASRLRFEG